MNKDKKKDVGNPPIDIEEFDTEVKDRQKQRLSNYIQKAKGEDRSIRKYAEAVGVSPAAISKYIKGEYVPSPSTMKKLTSREAEPRNGVSYEDLMEAAGYESDKEVEVIQLDFEGSLDGDKTDGDKTDGDKTDGDKTDGGKSDGTITDRKISGKTKRSLSEYREKCNRYEKDTMAQVFYSLVEKGVIFQKEIIDKAFGTVDLKLRIMDQPISQWMFDFEYMESDKANVSTRFRIRMLDAFGKALTYDMGENDKYSIVIPDKGIFDWVKDRYEHKLAYRGELSVILYDMDNDKIVDECYMSNYYKEDQGREIKII